MKRILFYLTTLLISLSCQKTETKAPEYLSTVTINGNIWNTDNTSPGPTGSHVTLYYYKSTQKVTLSVINDDTGEKVVLVLKAPNSVDSKVVKFDGTDYTANFFLKDENLLMNKKVTGEIQIHQIKINDDMVSNFDASFNFVQTSNDIVGTSYTHKVENARIKNLKQTI